MKKIIISLLLFFCLSGFSVKDIFNDDNCRKNKFKGISNDCFSCDTENAVEVSHVFECTTCSNRKIIKNDTHYLCVLHCPKDFFESSYDKTCYPCDIKYPVYASADECLKCPNKTTNKNGFCVFKDCPAGTFNNRGSCMSCDNVYPHAFVEEAECLKCSNREIMKNGEQTYCVSKCEGMCRDIWGYCYRCGDCFHPSAYVVSEEECLKCPNRQMEDGMCVSKTKCPQGTKLSPYNTCEPIPVY